MGVSCIVGVAGSPKMWGATVNEVLISALGHKDNHNPYHEACGGAYLSLITAHLSGKVRAAMPFRHESRCLPSLKGIAELVC